MNDKLDRLELVRSAWDAYDPDYMDFPLQANPDSHKDFAEGAVILNPMVTEIVGDVGGQKLLDICCACDATQAFSWANLGRCDGLRYQPRSLRDRTGEHGVHRSAGDL